MVFSWAHRFNVGVAKILFMQILAHYSSDISECWWEERVPIQLQSNQHSAHPSPFCVHANMMFVPYFSFITRWATANGQKSFQLLTNNFPLWERADRSSIKTKTNEALRKSHSPAEHLAKQTHQQRGCKVIKMYSPEQPVFRCLLKWKLRLSHRLSRLKAPSPGENLAGCQKLKIHTQKRLACGRFKNIQPSGPSTRGAFTPNLLGSVDTGSGPLAQSVHSWLELLWKQQCSNF